MCPNPIPGIPLKTYLVGAVAAVFLTVSLYCKVLYDENAELKTKYSELTNSYDKKVTALTECSNGVANLAKREEELTKNAKEAVDKAKKGAAAEYKASNDILFRKPVQPEVTHVNAKDYGGDDVMVQLKDYLATQLLMNELIDQRGGK
jgi:uncharacterized protein YoxC